MAVRGGGRAAAPARRVMPRRRRRPAHPGGAGSAAGDAGAQAPPAPRDGLLRDLPALFRRTGLQWLEQRGQERAAAIAFNTLLSMAPLVLLLLAGMSRVLDTGEARSALIETVALLAGPQTAEAAGRVVGTIAAARSSPLTTIVSVLLMVHFSSAVFAQLRGMLNRIWNVSGDDGLRGLLRERVVTWLFVPLTLLAAGGVMVLGFTLAALLPLLAERIPGGAWLLPLGNAAVPFVLITALLALLYRYGPGAAVAWRDVWLGATFVGFLLAAGNTLLGFMVGRSMLVSLYGAAGALVVTTLWVFYGAHLLLFGAHLCRVYAERHGSLAAVAGARTVSAPEVAGPARGSGRTRSPAASASASGTRARTVAGSPRARPRSARAKSPR